MGSDLEKKSMSTRFLADTDNSTVDTGKAFPGGPGGPGWSWVARGGSGRPGMACVIRVARRLAFGGVWGAFGGVTHSDSPISMLKVLKIYA